MVVSVRLCDRFLFLVCNRPVSIGLDSAENNGPQYEALGNNYRVCGVYFPEPRAEVCCVRLNSNLLALLGTEDLNFPL